MTESDSEVIEAMDRGDEDGKKRAAGRKRALRRVVPADELEITDRHPNSEAGHVPY
jgi:hypothetical protein